MTVTQSNSEDELNTNEAIIRTKKSFSMVWFIPIIALLIGGWLVYKAVSEKGPTITISFKSADGLEAGKTKIKYKDVDVGRVVSIDLKEDLAGVIVTAELGKKTKSFLTDKTRFWVVRARISAGEISGIGTLLGGAYIAIDPVKEGRETDAFTGLEIPPIIATDLPGSRYVLRSQMLGSLDAGSPIYYKQIQVGQVEHYVLGKAGQHVDINVFINSPYNQYVNTNTRFWNAGGIDVTMDANGLKVNSQSLVSILTGGIAFDNPVSIKAEKIADNNNIFKLFNNRQDAMEATYTVKRYWLLNFKGSVRGLSKDAPVEFKGLQVGKVKEIKLNTGEGLGKDALISVLIVAEPGRLIGKKTVHKDSDYHTNMDSLVKQGFRAQLKTGSILTGQLYVDLDFHENEPVEKINWQGKYPVLPTVPGSLEELMAVINRVLEKIETIPFEQIGQDIQSVVKVSEAILKQVNTDIAPEIAATLKQSAKTMAEIEKTFGNESPLNRNAIKALGEFSEAAQSLRDLTDYLERHPEALIYGKGDK